jgi:farnesyl diphosphate synthase
MDWIPEFNSQFLAALQQAPLRSTRLKDALIYAAKSPGKRLRPMFVHETAQQIGLAPAAIVPLATAIESVHLFSLIHDDLPALDNDDFRRGLPTLHNKFDEGTALLAGDELLNFAYSCFAGCAGSVTPAAFLIALRYFSRCIGGAGMIGGQMLELELVHESRDADLESLISIQDLKTGALFRASILTPLLLSGEHPESKRYEEFESYANAFGFAFQIADDLDDEAQDQSRSSKNILSLMGRESAIRLAVDRLSASPPARNFSATSLLISRLESNL